MAVFVQIALAVTLVSSFITGSWTLQRFPRRTGDHAPSGQCETFKWGGKTGLHWYVCCNNCEDTDKSCDGITYQSASKEEYCDTCGVDNVKGNGKPDSIYGCGGCTGQNDVEDKCVSKLRKVYQIPGFCWAFAKCFKKNCGKLSTLDDGDTALSFGVTEDSCFDLVCDDGETVDTCPVDCCGTVNDVCDWRKYNGANDCPPVCCSESTCCKGTSGAERILGETALMLVTTIWVLAWRLQ